MAQKACFFDSVDGDRRYIAEDFIRYFKHFVTNGIFNETTDRLAVVNDNLVEMGIYVLKGGAWINGYYYFNDSPLKLTVNTSDSINPRIDRVVLRLSLDTRSIYAAVKKGEPAANPVPPEYTRNEAVYELVLADVRVNAAATSITQSNITDKRSDTTLCGAVKSFFRTVYV